MGPKRRTGRSSQGAAPGLVLSEIQNKNIQTPPKNKQLPAVSKITKGMGYTDLMNKLAFWDINANSGVK